MPRRSREELARAADASRRAAEEAPTRSMSFVEAQTPLRYLTAKLLERGERRRFEREQPRRRAEAAEAERQFTDSLSYKDGGMVRGCKSSQMSGKGFRGTY